MTTPAAASPPVAEALKLKCPVCSAGFRGMEICPRCGTNLKPLMHIAARAWALRQASRAMVRAGDLAGALCCSSLAWEVQHHGAAAAGLERIAESHMRTLNSAPLPSNSNPEEGRDTQMGAAGMTDTNPPSVAEKHQRASANGMAEPQSAPESVRAVPAPPVTGIRQTDDTRQPGAPWPFALALTLPALFWIAYLLLTRRTPGNHSAGSDGVALLMVFAAGTALYWRGSRASRPMGVALLLYVLSQASWLVVLGILIANRLEQP
jgi:hypothetical protein